MFINSSRSLFHRDFGSYPRNLTSVWAFRGDISFPIAPRVGPKFDRFNEYGSLNTLTNSLGNRAHTPVDCGSQPRGALK